MIHINVAGNRLTATTDAPLVAKTVGVVMFEAEFDDSWEGYQRKIVFTGKGGEESVWYTGGVMKVPWQPMDVPGILRISAVGLEEGKRKVTAVIDVPLMLNRNGSLGENPADPTPGLTVLEQVELSCIQSEGRAKAAAEKSEIKALESEASAESSARSAVAAEVSKVRAVEAEDNARFFMGQSKEAAVGAVQAMEQAQEAENRTEELAESASVSAGAAHQDAVKAAQERKLAEQAKTAASQYAEAAENSKAGAVQADEEAKKTVAKVEPDIERLYAALIRDTMTGAVVQGNFVPGTSLDYRVDIEAKQEGEGEPSPENIRKISGADNVNIQVCKNNIAESVFNENAEKRFTSILFVETALRPNTTYTISFIGEKNNKIYLNEYIARSLYYTCTGEKQIIKFTTTGILSRTNRNQYSIGKGWCIFKNQDTNEIVSNFSEVQLTFYDSYDDYEPYIGIAHTIKLPETCYGGYIDYNRWKYVKDWNVIILKGIESITQGKTIADGLYRYYFQVKDALKKEFTPILSHFKSIKASATYSTSQGCGFNDGSIFIYNTGETVEEFKAYLAEQAAAGTPLTIAYKLETPIEYDLADLPALTALDGKTTIYSDAKEVSVTGYMDTKKYIDNKLAKLTALTLEV